MSEYFTLDAEPTDDPDVQELVTNHTLTAEDEEEYLSPEEGEEGSAIAQVLFSGVEGIVALTIVDDTLIVTRDPDVPWEYIVDDVREALRDFFL